VFVFVEVNCQISQSYYVRRFCKRFRESARICKIIGTLTWTKCCLAILKLQF